MKISHLDGQGAACSTEAAEDRDGIWTVKMIAATSVDGLIDCYISVSEDSARMPPCSVTGEDDMSVHIEVCTVQALSGS